MNFLLEHYQWWRALHIIFIVCWFASLFYLPRFFVYHSQAMINNDQEAMRYFKTMEKKLYFIGHIGMGFAIIFGILLMVANNFQYLKGQSWLHLKLLLVVLLIIYYCYCGRIMKKFAKDINLYNEKFYRWFNEVPAILLIVIVFIAILKPF